MACRFLKYFAEMLPLPFIRIHKSHIVNLNFVKLYNKGGFITLEDGAEIEISPTYKEDFLKNFK
jgi:two-component system LytT family response regulator